MNLIRKTRLWTDPRKKSKSYYVKMDVQRTGLVDLVDTYCVMHNADPIASKALSEALVKELVRLLVEGHKVNIAGLGVLSVHLKSSQLEYGRARELGKSSIKGLAIKLSKAPGLRKELSEALEKAKVL